MGQNPPLSTLFIPLPSPPPLLGLNPLSVPAVSLNYSVERCCSPTKSHLLDRKRANKQIDGVVAERDGGREGG